MQFLYARKFAGLINPTDDPDTTGQPLQQIFYSLPLQQIFYGAPGTGKSKTVNDTTEQMPKENVFRVTFHPDSDYASFVGCYKPVAAQKKKFGVVSFSQLVSELNQYKNISKVSYPETKFGVMYWPSIKEMSSSEIENLVTSCGISKNMAIEVRRAAVAGEYYNANQNSEITYEFVPQAFIKAYVRAMQNPDKQVMLVIEEINRGNCAQIFGDMFQLLDRNDEGLSDYAVKPDTDLEAYLKAELGDKYNENEGMRLPKNLYIWATMNTSDQSLFPIDSAFKRRWEWKYMSIKDCSEGYKIVLGNGKEYDWYEFISKMNGLIADKTDSEDKQMGYFFIKAQDGKISADRFVNKVLFYLYNDVFKSYDLPTEFGNKKFTAFFTDTDTKVAELLDDLDVKKLNEPDSAEASEDTAEE